MTFKTLPSWRVKKTLKSECTLHKVTETLIGDVGDEYDEFAQTEESETTFTIKAEIQVITLEDLVWYPAGTIETGDAFGYFLPSYKLQGKTRYIEVGDYITYKSIKYRVERINDYYFEDNSAFRRAYLKRQVGV